MEAVNNMMWLAFVKPGTPGFLKLLLCQCMYACLCIYVCMSTPEAMYNKWHDMDPICVIG